MFLLIVVNILLAIETNGEQMRLFAFSLVLLVNSELDYYVYFLEL